MFCTRRYRAIKADEKDLAEIQTIYNSNKAFLLNHTDVGAANMDWCLREYRDMLESGFSRYKIVEAENEPSIGFIDFKISEETYLSLLILHGQMQKRGSGKEVYLGFEEYIRSQNGKSIRIDVVTDYNESSLGFWMNNGFILENDILLSWGESRFPAQRMIKVL